MARELTKKQQGFVTALCDPDVKSYSEAYRTAYDCGNMSQKAIRIEASRLHAHPGVSAALDKAKDKADRERARTKIAERLLGLEAGMFSERIEVAEKMPKTDAETLAEIEEILGNVLDD